MKEKPLTNLIASIQQRLRNQAKDAGEDFQLILNRYFRERFLFRLGLSPFKSRYLLKGAALLVLWEKNPYRSTMDLDLLRTGEAGTDAITDEFRAICGQVAEDDGVKFDPESISVDPIREDQEYMGLRVHVVATLGKIRTRLQVDVGIGDSVWPESAWTEYPVMLGMQAPKVRSYARETVIAEKLEAMVVLGMGNSRIKDFFDIVHLAEQFPFKGSILTESIKRTFKRRKTPIPDTLPIALEDRFWDLPVRKIQVAAFVRRTRLQSTFEEARMKSHLLREFLGEPLIHADRPNEFRLQWNPGGPWKNKLPTHLGSFSTAPFLK